MPRGQQEEQGEGHWRPGSLAKDPRAEPLDDRCRCGSPHLIIGMAQW
jgi:hypothetical protein